MACVLYGPNSGLTIVSCEGLKNSTALEVMNEVSRRHIVSDKISEDYILYYSDLTILIPIPHSERPFQAFPQAITTKPYMLSIDINNNPHFSLDVKSNMVRLHFHSRSHVARSIFTEFEIQFDGAKTVGELFRAAIDRKTWRDIMKMISKQIGVDMKCIILKMEYGTKSELLFPTDSLSTNIGDFLNESGQLITKGKLTYDVVSIIQSPTLFQKSILRVVSPFRLQDFLPHTLEILYTMASEPPTLISEISEVLSSLFWPVVTKVCKSIVCTFTTFEELSLAVKAEQDVEIELDYDDQDEALAKIIAFSCIYTKNFCQTLIEISRGYRSYFNKPIFDQQSPFSGPVIFYAPVFIERSAFTIILTRGFLYICDATLQSDNSLFPTKVSIMKDSQPVLYCTLVLSMWHFLPLMPNGLALLTGPQQMLIDFQDADSMISFWICFELSRIALKQTTIKLSRPEDTDLALSMTYPYNHLDSLISADVKMCGREWSVTFSHEQLLKASANPNFMPDEELLFLPEQYSARSLFQLHKQPVSPTKLAEMIDSAPYFLLPEEMTRLLSQSLVSDGIFSANPQVFFNVMLLFNVSNFTFALKRSDPGLLHAQLEAFSPFLEGFFVESTPFLHYACSVADKKELIEVLLEYISVNTVDPQQSRTALFHALRNPHLTIADALIHGGIDIDAVDSTRMTPLVFCLLMKDFRRARFLLNNGAQPHRTLWGRYASALEYMVNAREADCIKFLLPYCGDSINLPNDKGFFITHVCICAGIPEIIKSIEQACPEFDPNFGTIVYPHPLIYAVKKKLSPIVIECLLTLTKIDVNVYDRDGKTPLLIATEIGNVDAIKRLVGDSRCDIDNPCSTGTCPLFAAVTDQNLEIAEILLKAGALPNMPNRKGVTSLQVATENQNNEMIALLKKYGAKGGLWS